MRLLGVVSRLIQGRCCLGVGLTLSLYSLPLTRKYLKGSGKCEFDKKPSYWSKECQKADWKNHKPFCCPGAECSVIDDGTWDAVGPPKPSRGTIQLPITHAGGSRTFVSSSTMDVKTLKEVRDIVEGSGVEIPAESSSFLEGTTVEMMRI